MDLLVINTNVFAIWQHDSGGPVFEETNGRVTLIGIIGWGGCLDGKPGGSARVTVYSRWIYVNSQN